VAVLDDRGVIKEEVKFATPKSYGDFLLELKHAATSLKIDDFKAGAIGIPGQVDRKRGRGIKFGNLPWENVNIQHDAEQIFHCPTVIENDAKLAALSEAMLLKDHYNKVVYITISTGIGYALIMDGVIDTGIGDSGGASLLLEHKGKLMPWEDFASGQAIVKRFGKMAEDITDKSSWEIISREFAQGMIQIIAMLEPDVIVIGGSVGNYFDRYNKLLETALKKYKLPIVDLPAMLQAQRPDKAVVYGCYDLAKQVYGHGKTDS
jgi:glucokinase